MSSLHRPLLQSEGAGSIHQTQFSLVQLIEERSHAMELPLLEHSSPVLRILFLSGDKTYKKIPLTDYQRISKNYCQEKFQKTEKEALDFMPTGQ